MNRVRLGIMGLGNIGQHHAGYLQDGQVERCELTALCSSSAGRLEKFKKLPVFAQSEDFFKSGLVDAVLIATPHYQHAPLGMAAFEHGIHVMVEKPIAAHKADAERLIATHRQHPALTFAGMFQLRIEPRYLRIRELIQAGKLGDLVRVNWIITDWYRTEAYYTSSAWRATWRGEGGGVLLNQCLHNLDMLTWLMGPPARLRGFCQLGRYHQIEVEDDATAYLEFPNGATGVLVTSTGESPGTNRLEIVGTLGKVTLENGRLTWTRNESSMVEFSQQAQRGFVSLPSTTQEIPFENAATPHADLLRNFVEAILDNTPLIAPGEEGLHSLELANAILYSSLIGRTVELPLDGAAYERKLRELIDGSTRQKKVAPVAAEQSGMTFGR